MDPKAILATIDQSAAGALQKAGATAKDVVGVGITNQRESTIVWDRRLRHSMERVARMSSCRLQGSGSMTSTNTPRPTALKDGTR